MSRWLARLRDEEKNTKTHFDAPDKTDETPRQPVLSVLSVRQSGECEKEWGDDVRVAATPVVPFTPRAGPGITIRPPAIEVAATVYDDHLDMLIADAAANGEGVGRLSSMKRCGAVVPRGADWIFTRGRA